MDTTPDSEHKCAVDNVLLGVEVQTCTDRSMLSVWFSSNQLG